MVQVGVWKYSVRCLLKVFFYWKYIKIIYIFIMSIEKHLKSINWIFFSNEHFEKLKQPNYIKKRALKWAHCQRKLLLSMWKTKRNPFHFETFPYLVLVSPCYFTYPEYINLYIHTRSMKFPLEPTSKNLQCFLILCRKL
jgi:hypothetical protein